MATAAPGSIVTLTDAGPIEGGPEPGDVLETRTGRRYLLLERTPSGKAGARYRCVVMDPADEYPEGSVRFSWAWTPREPRRRRRERSRA